MPVNWQAGGRTMSRNRKGFTLVEILIVVIILGILAAIVVPQFSEASRDAKLSNLTTNLQSIRAQLELYRLHHNGLYPPDIVTGLTNKSGQDGVIDNVAGAYGPYMQQFPSNPFIDGVGANTIGVGWTYDSASGAFAAVADADGHEDL
jgi:general secretion pathway protein G